jgi:ubiquinone/menaquinone biosynthesis C-methylase UbiE
MTSSPAALDVTTLPGYTDPQSYSDGPIEDCLLDLFRQTDPQAVEAAIQDILHGSPSWPERVHLSPQRHHLLGWFPFEPHGRLLEVGAGCGALTGLFATRVAQVDALDTSAKRASILAHRHRAATNVRVLVGDIEHLPEAASYDYVALIGVLEYAGTYARHAGDNLARDPYVRLLAQARRLLNDQGVLLLAIENQVGLKYLAGYYEDHYGKPLIGIEDYLADQGVRTFGRSELAAMLKQAGFGVERWYYPFPDYKLPSTIYSDDQLPGSIEHVSTLYPTLDYSSPNDNYFAEARLARVLQRNGLTSMFANSFLAVCKAL